MTDWISRLRHPGLDSVALDLPSRNAETDSISESEFKDYLRTDFEFQRYGWGYGNRDGASQFAIVTLVLHIVVVLVYAVLSFVFHYFYDGWTSDAWGDINQLVTLSLLSPSVQALRNCGVGIDRSATWLTRFRIRAVPPTEDGEQHRVLLGATRRKIRCQLRRRDTICEKIVGVYIYRNKGRRTRRTAVISQQTLSYLRIKKPSECFGKTSVIPAQYLDNGLPVWCAGQCLAEFASSSCTISNIHYRVIRAVWWKRSTLIASILPRSKCWGCLWYVQLRELPSNAQNLFKIRVC
ncbi:hypothetical protein F4803DRAFT_570051 [Xylaria telfairii]|nr:hypothetical protein F4803DRAFT_570051 [Xylaria telfairii]